MPNKVIKVLIVDDHPRVRQGLAVVLELWDEFELVGEASNGQEAVNLVEKLQPDVVLMDLIMPVMDGVTATRKIRQKFPHVQVIVLTSTIEQEFVDSAIEAGAARSLFKNVTIDTLADAIYGAVSQQP